MNKTYCPECADLWRRLAAARVRYERKVDMVRLSSYGKRIPCAFVVPGTQAAKVDLDNVRAEMRVHLARGHK